ncbi:hypothetical protein CB1_000480002 [Camelus ferus]|nr:hypothetical protein CB1_000480002 [Camelus ferus]
MSLLPLLCSRLEGLSSREPGYRTPAVWEVPGPFRIPDSLDLLAAAQKPKSRLDVTLMSVSNALPVGLCFHFSFLDILETRGDALNLRSSPRAPVALAPKACLNTQDLSIRGSEKSTPHSDGAADRGREQGLLSIESEPEGPSSTGIRAHEADQPGGAKIHFHPADRNHVPTARAQPVYLIRQHAATRTRTAQRVTVEPSLKDALGPLEPFHSRAHLVMRGEDPPIPPHRQLSRYHHEPRCPPPAPRAQLLLPEQSSRELVLQPVPGLTVTDRTASAQTLPTVPEGRPPGAGAGV